MTSIEYQARNYRAPHDDSDASVPIATPVTCKDYAFALAQDGHGRYIYERLVEIRVTTARPVELKSSDKHVEPVRRWVIEVKTRDRSVATSHLAMAWFPYSFDWDDWTTFKGHRNRGKDEIAPLLDQLASGEIPFDEFLRNNKYRDVYETNSRVWTAYFPDPRRSNAVSWSVRRSQLLKPVRSDALEATELLAFGICPDLPTTVEAVLREDAILKLISAVDEWVFYRLWKNHPFCPPRRLQPQLLAPETVDMILRSSIRKAIAGPVRNQKSFIGWPVSSWAKAIFLGSLYDLNRRGKLPDVLDPSASFSDEQWSPPTERPAESDLDFLAEVASLSQHFAEESLDFDSLLEAATNKLPSQDARKRINALALIAALRSVTEISPRIVNEVGNLARDDADSNVRMAASIALRTINAEN